MLRIFLPHCRSAIIEAGRVFRGFQQLDPDAQHRLLQKFPFYSYHLKASLAIQSRCVPVTSLFALHSCMPTSSAVAREKDQVHECLCMSPCVPHKCEPTPLSKVNYMLAVCCSSGRHSEGGTPGAPAASRPRLSSSLFAVGVAKCANCLCAGGLRRSHNLLCIIRVSPRNPQRPPS